MNIPSPCILVCQLDDSDVCIGCYRTRDEIARWLQMTDAEKLEVLSRLGTRKAEVTELNEWRAS